MTAVLTDTVTIDGRTLAPGEVFRPLPEQPDYEVMFVRLDKVTAILADCCGSWSLPLTPKEI